MSINELYKNQKDNINIYGYLQDPIILELLKIHKQKVLNWFRFKPEIDELLRQETEKYRPWIGIHIRRGDFIKRGLALPVVKYIELLKNIKNAKKLYISIDDKSIISDFKDFELINLKNPLPDIPDFVFDFWMLKNSETILGCGSTFSWWAAYLNKGGGGYYSPPLTHLWPVNYNPKLEKIEI